MKKSILVNLSVVLALSTGSAVMAQSAKLSSGLTSTSKLKAVTLVAPANIPAGAFYVVDNSTQQFVKVDSVLPGMEAKFTPKLNHTYQVKLGGMPLMPVCNLQIVPSKTNGYYISMTNVPSKDRAGICTMYEGNSHKVSVVRGV